MMSLRFTFFLQLLTVASSTFYMQVPKRELGYVYKSGAPDAKIHVDFYLDQICLDSKTAWPVLIQVADTYGPSKLRLTVHLFPLPHHRNGFTASKAAEVIQCLSNTSMVFTFIQKGFDVMDTLKQTATRGLDDDEVIEKFANIAGDMGVNVTSFKAEMENDDHRAQAILEWRYGCTRGVTGTPRFTVNDIAVQASPTWTLEDWKKVIDPLLE